MKPLSVPGTIDSLGIVGQYVLDAAQWAGLENRAAYKLRLAVDEIATNAVIHGYQKHDQSGALRLNARQERDHLVLVLEDSGPAYDPRDTPPPGDLDKPPQARSVGGLGVYLALKGVDSFAYQRLPGINRNIFLMRCAKV